MDTNIFDILSNLIGALIGAFIAVYVSRKEQKRQPQLIKFEKKIEAHADIAVQLFILKIIFIKM